MKKTTILRLLFALLLVFTAATATNAKQYTVGDVPNVRLQDARRYVSDPTAILSPAARDTIDAVLGQLEAKTGIETAVVMLPSIGDNDIFDFAHELFRTWGIGNKKNNNGLLILFVMDQRKVRFTTGYGVEGTMTDAMSKRIQQQQMVPHFKEGDWDAGMVDGVKATARVLDGSMQADSEDDEEYVVMMIVAVTILVGMMILFIVFIGEMQRCPKCRKKGIKSIGQQIIKRNGRRVRRTTFICQNCGHTFYKDEYIDKGGNGAAFVAGSMMGGGGGGFRGGSFGGGLTGGGGATSGW